MENSLQIREKFSGFYTGIQNEEKCPLWFDKPQFHRHYCPITWGKGGGGGWRAARSKVTRATSRLIYRCTEGLAKYTKTFANVRVFAGRPERDETITKEKFVANFYDRRLVFFFPTAISLPHLVAVEYQIYSDGYDQLIGQRFGLD